MPETQYGNPGAGGIYDYWDTVNLNVPANAASADIQLLYQGTSWEYIQFLFLANTGQNAFLGEEGVNMLEAWLNATNPDGKTMVPPVVMATATWGTPPTGNNPPVAADDSYSIRPGCVTDYCRTRRVGQRQ